MAGVAGGLCAILYVWLRTPVAYTWYVVVGALTTFTVGWMASLFQGRSPDVPEEESLVRQPVGGTPHLPSQRAKAEE